MSYGNKIFYPSDWEERGQVLSIWNLAVKSVVTKLTGYKTSAMARRFVSEGNREWRDPWIKPSYKFIKYFLFFIFFLFSTFRYRNVLSWWNGAQALKINRFSRCLSVEPFNKRGIDAISWDEREPGMVSRSRLPFSSPLRSEKWWSERWPGRKVARKRKLLEKNDLWPLASDGKGERLRNLDFVDRLLALYRRVLYSHPSFLERRGNFMR